MGSLPRERVQDDGQCGHEGLSLARLHLGDLSLVEGHSSHELDVEMTQTYGTLGYFANDRENLRKKIVERFTRFDASAELRPLRLEFFIAQSLHRRFEFVDSGCNGAVSRERTFVWVQPKRAPDPFKH